MKKLVFTLLLIPLIATASAQISNPTPEGNGQNGKKIQAKRAYILFASNEDNATSADNLNGLLIDNDKNSVYSRGFFSDIANAVFQSYGSTMITKTASATSTVLNAGISYISSLVNKEKDAREAWLKAAKSQCSFKNSFPSESKIEDFYFLTSEAGPMDPMNIKFRGFGCYCYMRPENMPVEKRNKLDTSYNDVMEFLVSCRLRTDSAGIAHIVNHSKFYVELDQVVFDTRHVALANDSMQRDPLVPFKFDRRKNLTLNLNVKVYSSWINEAAMIFSDQQIGEFNITAKIPKNRLNDKYVFRYDPKIDTDNVFVTGESFVVPRSFSGTSEHPRWGTGQYRLEMTVSESCDIDEEFYMVPDSLLQSDKKGRQKMDKKDPNKMKQPKMEMHGNRNNKQWDKGKWMPEWEEMQKCCQAKGPNGTLWTTIKTLYVGNDWVQEVLTPFTTAVNTAEAEQLNGLFGIQTIAGSSGGGTKGGGVQGGGVQGGSK